MIFNINVPPYLGTHDPSIYSSGIVWIIANVEILKSVKQNKKIPKVNTAQENKVHVIVVVSAHRPWMCSDELHISVWVSATKIKVNVHVYRDLCILLDKYITY